MTRRWFTIGWDALSLNIGCGEHYAPGWTNTDLHDHVVGGPRPDVVCSLLGLPFPDGCAERVYCGHVLEHIPLDVLPAALEEIRRVLADDGELLIVGPDANLAEQFDPVLTPCVVNGGRRWPGDEHKWTATGELTLAHVHAAGFAADLIAVVDVPDGWPVVARDWWQFAIEAKPLEF